MEGRLRKLTQMPRAKTVMTPFPWSVDAQDSLGRAIQMMQEHDIHHLPVADEGVLIGVVSDRDIKNLLSITAGHMGRQDLKVCDALARDPYLVDISTPLDEVVLKMAERHARSALVTKQGKLVGIFTATDACRSFGEFLRTLFPHPSDDAA